MTRIAIGSEGATYLVMARLDRAIQDNKRMRKPSGWLGQAGP